MIVRPGFVSRTALTVFATVTLSVMNPAQAQAADHNHNGVPDASDVVNGTSSDCNSDGIPDECQHLNSPVNFDGSPSLYLNGTLSNRQVVQVPYSPENNPVSFTVECWAKFTGTLGEGVYRSPLTSRFTEPDGSNKRGYLFYLTAADQWEFWTGQGPGFFWTILTGPTAQPGAWTHLAATYDAVSGITNFYVNAVQVATVSGFHYVPNPSAPLRIGAGTTETYADLFFKGQIDDVRIWNIVRTAAQIAASMGERMNGSEPGLRALYQLDEGTGLSVLDGAPAGGNADGMIEFSATWMPAVCVPCAEGIPTIADHPASAVICDGGSVALSVAVNGRSMAYQWRKNGSVLSNQPSHISGATTSTLLLTQALITDSGLYDCVATNPCGSITCNAASLSVSDCVADLNHNGISDFTDIANGTSRDCNADGIPDECQHLNAPAVFDGSPSLSFDGWSQYVESPYSAANNPPSFTVELWVKYTGAPGSGYYYSPLASRFGGAELRGYLFYLTPNDQWEFWTGGGGNEFWTILTGPTVLPGQWTHLAATYDAATGVERFFVNGAIATTATGFHYVPNLNAPLRIGAGTTESSPNYLFPGQIDDVRIWNSARTNAQIAQAMNERMSGTEPGLVTLYQLDEGAGIVAADSAPAGGADDGELFSDPAWAAAATCTSCPGATIPGDMNADMQVDGNDIQSFVAAVIAGGAPSGGTCPANMNHDGVIDTSDVPLFIAAILGA